MESYKVAAADFTTLRYLLHALRLVQAPRGQQAHQCLLCRCRAGRSFRRHPRLLVDGNCAGSFALIVLCLRRRPEPHGRRRRQERLELDRASSHAQANAIMLKSTCSSSSRAFSPLSSASPVFGWSKISQVNASSSRRSKRSSCCSASRTTPVSARRAGSRAASSGAPSRTGRAGCSCSCTLAARSRSTRRGGRHDGGP